MVATALAWRDSLDGRRDTKPRKSAAPATDTASRQSAADVRREVLRRFLLDQDKAWLADQPLQAAAIDPVLEKRLLLAARTRQAEDDAKALERALSEAIASPGVLDWRGSNRFAHRLDAPIDHLTQLLDAGRAEAALGGCLYLLKRLLPIYERSDDSSGAIGEHVQYLGRLTEKALRAVKPGKAVALKFVELALADRWSVFGDAEHTQWFDAQGLAAFEAEIEKRLRALKPLPLGKSRFTSGDDRFELQSSMETIARRRCDVDGLVEEERIDETAAPAESQPLPLRTLGAALRHFARQRPETAFNLLRRWLPDALRNANVSQYRRAGEVLLDIGRDQTAGRFASLRLFSGPTARRAGAATAAGRDPRRRRPPVGVRQRPARSAKLARCLILVCPGPYPRHKL